MGTKIIPIFVLSLYFLLPLVMAESQFKSHEEKVDFDDHVLEGEKTKFQTNRQQLKYFTLVSVRGWFKKIKYTWFQNSLGT